MKKHILQTTLALAAMMLLHQATASAQYVISLTDGQKLTWSGFSFVKGSGDDTWLVRKDGQTSGGTDISRVVSITAQPLAERSWKTPTYPDDYRYLAGWSNRSKWNLANIHDPTVMKADDGYYYMYQHRCRLRQPAGRPRTLPLPPLEEHGGLELPGRYDDQRACLGEGLAEQ